MSDITDTLIIIQIKAFIIGQRALLKSPSDREADDWMKGYNAAVENICKYIDDLMKMDLPSEAPWANTYKEQTQ